MKRNLKILLISILSISNFSCLSENRSTADAIANKNRPNILILLTDDQSFNTINALGNKEISTPNICSVYQKFVFIKRLENDFYNSVLSHKLN